MKIIMVITSMMLMFNQSQHSLNKSIHYEEKQLQLTQALVQMGYSIRSNVQSIIKLCSYLLKSTQYLNHYHQRQIDNHNATLISWLGLTTRKLASSLMIIKVRLTTTQKVILLLTIHMISMQLFHAYIHMRSTITHLLHRVNFMVNR